MLKKIIIIAALCSSICIYANELDDILAEESQKGKLTETVYKAICPVKKTKEEKIDFVLFTLIGNQLRLERYALEDLKNKTIDIPRDISKEHTVFIINMKERRYSTKKIEWDEVEAGRMNINTHHKSTPQNYVVYIESIFKEAPEDVMVICFDCSITTKKNEKNRWYSKINIILPIKIDDEDINVTFNSKVKGACGFFMERKEFKRLVKYSGKMSKKAALRNGLLVKSAETTNESMAHTGIYETVKDNMSYLKNKVITTLVLFKQLAAKPLNACIQCFSKK